MNMSQRILKSNLNIMEAPDIVKKAAKSLIDMYGDSLAYLGEHEGSQAFCFNFLEDASVGFPVVFLYKDKTVTEVNGFEALDIVSLFVEDFEVV